MFTDTNIWEHLVKERKLIYFIGIPPVTDYEMKIQEYKEQCSMQPVDENLTKQQFYQMNQIEEYFLPTIIDINQHNQQIANISDWRKIFYKYHNKICYKGVYLGDYDSHGIERLEAFQIGYFVFFIKLTGDPNIPQGKITFYMRLTEDLKNGIGYIQLADTGYISPRWGQAAISVKKHSNKKDVAQGELQKNMDNIYKQIKVDWFIKQVLIITFTQKFRFAIWKEEHEFKIKNKQKFLNIMYQDFHFSNLSFSSSLSPLQFFDNLDNNNNNNNNNQNE
ncbi:hypothetical protein TTHERM_00680680 (macronuclear) [Tetrahymena thermophila SB210]|uniref:Uncharacterized protein n=1 Tax=Tetrahymena thermophila (strain SB210) TaxID=312017 RepID=I7MJP5_TETTS|nr:hypothetical protein TTHERM_00680680 [Tetrahymena thermophila SB210]EAS07061.2 hypothetical protein TTHERM_00680680 [Tetrahymena thermophila SB210]|eukprot:XP_001027303.2 hypothetical protein TTHERM_00680680 [Tetrahymena thermophila SB210]